MQPDRKPPLRDRGHGRWPGILAALGVSATALNTRKHHPCPWCGGKDRFRFTDKDGSGAFYCGQCGSHSPVDDLMHVNSWDFAKAAKEVEAVIGDAKFKPQDSKSKDASSRKAMQKLWDQAVPIAAGDFVDAWFAGRGIRQTTYCRWLKKIDRAEYVDDDDRKSWHPAMVAKILAPDGTPTNLHRTYLTLNGQKADVGSVRKVMAGGIAKGSAIRLFGVGPVLGVAEGIETALAASALFGVPVWSTINSTILSGWQPPEGVGQVIIFGDNDPQFGGQAAATALAHKLACNKSRPVSVRIEIPPIVGQDWNDVLLQRRAAAA
jgi:putative DNA primase/helicase